MQGMQVRSQVGKLKAYIFHGVAKKGNKQKKKQWETNTGRNMCPFPSHLDRSAVGPSKDVHILILRNCDYVNVTQQRGLTVVSSTDLAKGRLP